MDQAHVHLMITHLPIFGSVLGACVLAYGIWKNSEQTLMASYFMLLISAIGAIIAYLTGEGAEETVEDIPGVAASLIGRHEDFALFALIALATLGLVSLFGLYVTLKKSPLTRNVAMLTVVFSIISFGLVARTGYLGGQIRHTEIGSSMPAATQPGEDDD